jgi:hypothetical protein
VQRRLGVQALEAGGNGAAVHDKIGGCEAENWNGVRCIGECVGGYAVVVSLEDSTMEGRRGETDWGLNVDSMSGYSTQTVL